MPLGRILVIRGGAIGDFVLTLPVLSALRAHLPDAGLEVLGYKHIVRIALGAGLADEIHSIEDRALASYFARKGDLDPRMGAFFNRFGIIVSYLYDPDLIFQENVDRVSDAQFIACPHRPDESANLHATEVFLRPLERLALFDPDPVPTLKSLASPEDTSAENFDAPGWLALHPGSGSESKNWPEAKWRGLIARLLGSSDLNLAIVSGEAEGERVKKLVAELPAQRVCHWQQLPLDELARRLRGCAGFVGHDSGITHLSAAVGLPVLALWPETNPNIWSPRSPKAKVLKQPGGLKALDPERVFAELQEMLGLPATT